MDATNAQNKYYQAGSSELATETPLTLTRLETRRVLTTTSSRLVIVLVGLPARGKSFVARKMEHYLNWSGVLCKIFNVGKYRRQAYASLQGEAGKGACDANFFDAKNEMAAQLREKVAEAALKDMLQWLDQVDDVDDGDDRDDSTQENSRHSTISLTPKLKYRENERIAIFDATNSTNKRRNWLLEQCTSTRLRGNKTTGVVFVESICDDEELLLENYKFKVSNSPDFEGISEEMALKDLLERVEKYEQQYQTIADDSLSYIKIFNLSTKLLCNHIYGRIAKELVPALMAWHIGSRPIFLVRPGQTVRGLTLDGEDYVTTNRVLESEFSGMSFRTKKKIMRGDHLGPAGIKFRDDLLEFMGHQINEFLSKRRSVQDMSATGTSLSGLGDGSWYVGGGGSFEDDAKDSENVNNLDSGSPTAFPLRVLTSTMPRALDTVVWDVKREVKVHQMSSLNPLDKGDFNGMELEEIRDINPEWYDLLDADPYGTRFPGGESYRDLIRRLTSVVIDMEQQVIPTLLVSHVSILQCLMAYFRNTPVENCMSIEVPLHTVIKFEPVRGGGFRETQHYLGEELVSSFGPLNKFISEVECKNFGGSSKDNSPQSNITANSATKKAGKTLPIWTDSKEVLHSN